MTIFRGIFRQPWVEMFREYTASPTEFFNSRWGMTLPDPGATFSCTSARNVWTYTAAGPSVGNPPILQLIDAEVQAIQGAIWDGTSCYVAEGMHPYTWSSTPDGIIRVYTEFATYLVATAYAAGVQVAHQTAVGNWLYMTSSGGTSDATAVVIAETDIGGAVVADNDINWTVVGYATLHLGGEVLEDAATNACPDSREFDAASWTVDNVTVNKNQVGIDGVANAATLLTDSLGVSETIKADAVAISSGALPHSARFNIKAEDDETSYPGILINLTGGVTQSIFYNINKKTGDFIAMDIFVGTGSCSVARKGDFWEATVVANGIATSTVMDVYIIPATSTVWGVNSGAATGTCIVDQCDIIAEGGFIGTPIFTSGGTVVRAATLFTNPIADILSAESGAGRIIFNPISIDTLAQKWILSTVVDVNNYFGILCTSGTSIVLRKHATGDTDATEAYTPLANTPFVVEFYYNQTDGMAIRAYSVGDAVPAWATNANTDLAKVDTDFEIGSVSSGTHFLGNYLSCVFSTDAGDLNFE